MTLPFEGAQSPRLAAGQFCWRHDHLALDWPCATPRNRNSSHGATTSQMSGCGAFATCRMTLRMSASRERREIVVKEAFPVGGVSVVGENRNYERHDESVEPAYSSCFENHPVPERS